MNAEPDPHATPALPISIDTSPVTHALHAVPVTFTIPSHESVCGLPVPYDHVPICGRLVLIGKVEVSLLPERTVVNVPQLTLNTLPHDVAAKPVVFAVVVRVPARSVVRNTTN